jgi:hypothetical protein
VKVATRKGDRVNVEGVEAVVVGRTLNDRSVRWHGGAGDPPVHGFYLRWFGVAVDRIGFLIVVGEWHLTRQWRRGPTSVYWGDIAPASLVDQAGGIDEFLRRWTR